MCQSSTTTRVWALRRNRCHSQDSRHPVYPLAGHCTAWPVRLTPEIQRCSQSVHRASHHLPSSIQDMGIDHGGLHVLVAEQLPDGSNGSPHESPFASSRGSHTHFSFCPARRMGKRPVFSTSSLLMKMTLMTNWIGAVSRPGKHPPTMRLAIELGDAVDEHRSECGEPQEVVGKRVSAEQPDRRQQV